MACLVRFVDAIGNLVGGLFWIAPDFGVGRRDHDDSLRDLAWNLLLENEGADGVTGGLTIRKEAEEVKKQRKS